MSEDLGPAAVEVPEAVVRKRSGPSLVWLIPLVAALVGAWLGWQQLPMIILMSAVVGAIIGIAMMVFNKHERSVPIPFGPYLAAAGWIAMLWGETIKTTYLDSML